MGLDALCMAAVIQELRQNLVGGKVDKVSQPGRDELVLAVRGRDGNGKLLLSASPNHPRAQMTTLTFENPSEPPMFCMLLRKHLVGGRFVSIDQPKGERVILFHLECTNELGDRVPRLLALEAMGRNTNLILVDDQARIIDCARRVSGDLATGQRQVMPGLFYEIPQPRDGVSPLIARELEFRGKGDGERMLAEIEGGNYTPTMLLREGVPVDFSFLPILQYGPEVECRPYPTFAALFDVFYAQRETRERVRQRGGDLVKSLQNARDRTARKIAVQTAELTKACDRERQRELGDLLTSNLHLLKKGMERATVHDYYAETGAMVEIPLDPRLTPQQNAARCYKTYTKAKTAEAMLTQQLAQARDDLHYLDSVMEGVALAEGERDLGEIRRELEDTGYLKAKKRSKKEMKVAPRPLEFRSTAGLRISVGKNNLQNDQLTCKQAGPYDLWFHTQKIHGSHVILWTEGKPPDDVSLTQAATLAAYYSQGRAGTKIPVDYTPVKYVKKPAGARPGMVIYTVYQTAIVDPDQTLVTALAVK